MGFFKKNYSSLMTKGKGIKHFSPLRNVLFCKLTSRGYLEFTGETFQELHKTNASFYERQEQITPQDSVSHPIKTSHGDYLLEAAASAIRIFQVTSLNS